MKTNPFRFRAETVAVAVLLALTCGLAVSAPNDAWTPPDGDTTIALTGKLHVVWGDPPPDSDLPPVKRYWITDDEAGDTVELILDDASLALLAGTVVSNGVRVTATG